MHAYGLKMHGHSYVATAHVAYQFKLCELHEILNLFSGQPFHQ